ncbi:MAG: transglutaminase family protein, partial [Maribacter dokdonensis]
ALHPTIGVDTPLVFDIVDDWNKKSIGGCTYFVAHPGGRSYDTYPVNSLEAESRRINRFWDIGMTQDEVTPTELVASTNFTGRMVEPKKGSNTFAYKEMPVNPEYPHVTDLRKK